MKNENTLAEHREQAISLIKNYFPKVQEALYYLEGRESKHSLAAYIDIRDVLSHFATLLREDIDTESARDNIANLCEHMRRAIAEPYQIAFENKLGKIDDQYNIYKYRLLKWERILFLHKHHFPIHETIKKNVINAKNLWIEGRRKKNSNMWDAKFEEAISHFIEAYDVLSDLEPKVQEVYNRIHERKFALYLALGGIVLSTVIAVIIAIL
ncbi:hypothetical protein FJY90_00625 [Candidatus Gottesmanbacteria bacterium]|nr:hypothetical protein [Candidatus Gottesmanbacteria bacterium]